MAEENFKSSDVLKFIYGGTCKKRFYILAIIRCEAEIYFSKVNNTIIIKQYVMVYYLISTPFYFVYFKKHFEAETWT